VLHIDDSAADLFALVLSTDLARSMPLGGADSLSDGKCNDCLQDVALGNSSID